MTTAIVIPSLNPTQEIITLVQSLRRNFFDSIVVVNDGSDGSFSPIFRRLEEEFDCIVLNHAVNLGKGRALKTAFNYILTELDAVDVCVTADGDGQHASDDIIKCALVANDTNLVLGIRAFDSNVPFKSKMGNRITAVVLRLFTGINLKDTQTGLRAFGRTLMASLMVISGERYEFELNMLIEANSQSYQIVQVPIATIYLDNNKASHFRPLMDSWKIYAIFVRYLVSSLTSSIVDIGIFTLLITLFGNRRFMSVLFSTLIARFISSFLNFVINKKYVFKDASRNAYLKYLTLVIIQFSLSTVFVYLLVNVFKHSSAGLIKALVDIVLFVISYTVQKHFIFRR